LGDWRPSTIDKSLDAHKLIEYANPKHFVIVCYSVKAKAILFIFGSLLGGFMTYTLNAPATVSAGVATPVSSVITAFSRLATDDQLGLLWVLYENMGRSITPAAPGAARLQFAEGLLAQVRDMPPADQLQFMRDLIERKNTPATRAYGVLTNNTKLAFWYQLAEDMRVGTVIQVPGYYKLSDSASAVFGQITKLDFNQQITVLRQVAISMGVDPIA
jgi:hypothetical protein